MTFFFLSLHFVLLISFENWQLFLVHPQNFSLTFRSTPTHLLNYSIFIVYYSAGMLFFLIHFLKKVMCLLTGDMTSRFYEIGIGCIVVNEIDVILKLLTWARKYNILFHKNKTILLSFKSFFVKVFTFVSMLALHFRV